MLFLLIIIFFVNCKTKKKNLIIITVIIPWCVRALAVIALTLTTNAFMPGELIGRIGRKTIFAVRSDIRTWFGTLTWYLVAETHLSVVRLARGSLTDERYLPTRSIGRLTFFFFYVPFLFFFL